jgi:hypothetical protein
MISREKADAIRALADADGYIEPSAVINAARNRTHPLHEEFNWNEREAAQSHWLDTARRLIRFVKLEIVIQHRTIQSVAYVVDPDRPPKSRRYVDLTVAAQSKNMAQQVLLSEMERITAAVRRAQQVATVLGLRRELDLLLQNVQDVVAAADVAAAKARESAGKKRKQSARGRRAEARV